MLVIQLCSPDRLTEVRDFYGRYGFWRHGLHRDRIIIATDGVKVTGAARLCRARGHLVFRDFQIRKNYQHQGIGSLMLRLINRAIYREECWCVARLTLHDFYRRIGFGPVAKSDVPWSVMRTLTGSGSFLRRSRRPQLSPPR